MADKLNEIYNELTSKSGKPLVQKKETTFEFEMDLKGNFSWVQPEAAALIGYTKDELEDISLWDVLAEKDHDRIAKKLEARKKGGKVDAYEVSLISKKGAEVRLSVETSPIIENGKAVRIKGKIKPI